MSHTPWFSVVIPFYNSEEYLEEAVCSVTGQTFSDIEILLVNDGSTDGSGDIARRLAEADSRIRLITLKENRGAAEARNEGVRRATGRYLTFLDADDVYEPGALAYVRNSLEKFRAEVVVWGVLQEDYYLSRNKNPIKTAARAVKSAARRGRGENQTGEAGETCAMPEGRAGGDAGRCVKKRVSRILPAAAVCRTREELRQRVLPLEKKGLYGYLWNKAYRLDVFRGRGIHIPTQTFNEDEMANIDFFEDAESALIIPVALTRYRRRLSGSLTHRYLEDYYEIAMRRVAWLLRQQKAWELDDSDTLGTIADIMLRYDLSALSRVADPRCQMTHAEKRKLARHMRTGSLGSELLPWAHPSSLPLRLLAGELEKGHVERCLLMGRAVHFAKEKLPWLFTRWAAKGN